MKINSPEVFLKSFNSRILNLINSTTILENPEIEKSLKLMYRKLTISEILFEKYIISISGLQGVGKTTLLKQIYSIPDDILPENIGRGEQLPVLITECGVKEISLSVNRLKEENGRFETVIESIDKDEFYKISKNPELNDLILEIKVPYKIFKDENKSFLLLPGFESVENEREELVYHSLISSATCIFLFNESENAKASNQGILDKVREKFENAKPLFITTFSDQSKDENKSLRENLIEKFNLQDEKDRVITTGTGTNSQGENRLDIWLPLLIDSLNKYSYTKSEFRKSQMENLRNLIDDEFLQIIANINDVKEDKFINEDITNNDNYSVPIKTLDDQIKKIKGKYLKNLSDYLDVYTVEPIKKIRESIRDEDWKVKIKKVVVGKSDDDNKKFENTIEEAWSTANNFSLNDIQTFTLNKLLSEDFNFHNKLEYPVLIKDQNDFIETIKSLTEDKPKLLGDFSQPDDTDNKNITVSASTTDDINKLFRPKNFPESIFSDDFEKSIKTIPLLMLEIQRIRSINPQKLEFNSTEQSSGDKIKEVSGDTEFLSTKAGMILPGVIALLGIDAVDGKIDIINGLSSALGVSSTLVAKSLLAGVGIVGAAIIVKSVITQMNKQDIHDANIANQIIHGIKDKYYAEYALAYDNMMEVLRDNVSQKFIERYHINKDFGRREWLHKTITDAKEDRYLLIQHLNKVIQL